MSSALGPTPGRHRWRRPGPIKRVRPAAPPPEAGIRFLLASLALQNLGRRKARTLLLFAAVAICSAAVFTSAVLMQSIERSMDVGFTRLGADMLIVPLGTLTNITAALLTAEPTDLTLDAGILDRLSHLKGIARVAPQLIFRTDAAGTGHQHEQPSRPDCLRSGARHHGPALAGGKARSAFSQGRRHRGGSPEGRVGAELLVFGEPLTVYGRLGRTAVGTHESGIFISFDTLAGLRRRCGGFAAPRRRWSPTSSPACLSSSHPALRCGRFASRCWPILPI